MTQLYRIKFRHYSPKDSERGTKTLLMAEDLEQVMSWMDKHCFYGGMADRDEEDDDVEVCPSDEWVENNAPRLLAAEAMGLKVDREWGATVSGPWGKLFRWWGEDPTEPQDCYYGFTSWGFEYLCDCDPKSPDPTIAMLRAAGLLTDATLPLGPA